VVVLLSPQLHRELVEDDRWGIGVVGFRPVVVTSAGQECRAWAEAPLVPPRSEGGQSSSARFRDRIVAEAIHFDRPAWEPDPR
jgi:hypothetical protein